MFLLAQGLKTPATFVVCLILAGGLGQADVEAYPNATLKEYGEHVQARL